MPRDFPSYRRHPNGQGFCKYKGKSYYFGRYELDTSRQDYERFRARMLSGLGVVTQPAPSHNGPIIELIAAYREHARRRYCRNGAATREFDNVMLALRRLDEHCGDMLSAEFRLRHLVAFQNYLITKGLCRTTINSTIGKVRRFFRWCTLEELVPDSLYHALCSVPGLLPGQNNAREPHAILPVERSTVEATLPFMSPVVAAMCQVQLYCCMRPGEVCRLHTDNLDRSGDVWLYVPPEHKNAWRGSVRTIPIPGIAQAILQAMLQDSRTGYVFSPRDADQWRAKLPPLPPSPNRKTKVYPCELRRRAKAKASRLRKQRFMRRNEAYCTASYYKSIKYAIKQANNRGVSVPYWHPNQLRHTMVTEVTRLLGPRAAQLFAGHEQLETTSIYNRETVADLIAIARKLNEIWRPSA